ncbi:hypothetical protein ACTTAI_14635 [Rhodobacter capsulatus]|uniref:hypothetical protein n=1 Tax=Rhodobacter capsulatus TaxID=1061 RepID=UPI004025B18A
MAFEDWQGSEGEFQLRYLTFMHLNVAHDAYNANRLSDTPNGHLEANSREMIALLRAQRRIAISILKGNRGYDKDFCRMCLDIIGDEPDVSAEQSMTAG